VAVMLKEHKNKTSWFVGKAPKHLQKPIQWRNAQKAPAKNTNNV